MASARPLIFVIKTAVSSVVCSESKGKRVAVTVGGLTVAKRFLRLNAIWQDAEFRSTHRRAGTSFA